MVPVFKSEHYPKMLKKAGLVQSMGNAGLSFTTRRLKVSLERSKPNYFTHDYGDPTKSITKQSLTILRSSITQSDLK